jgi:acyl carrier protein
MTYEEYDSVIKAKVAGAWNFHTALSGTALDFFVTISSAAGAVGNRGQAAYAAANTFLNAFVQYRVALGLPATTIDLTAVSDVGYLAENRDRQAAVAENLGSETISEIEVLALLGAAISGRMASTCNHHCITGMKITSPPPFWVDDAKFKTLRLAAAEAAALDLSQPETKIISLSNALKASRSSDEAELIISNGLVDKVSAVLMLDKEEMDVAKSISSYGLDSLVAIEIRNFITREFEANMQVLELLTSPSITALAKTIRGKSKLVKFKEEGGDGVKDTV